MSFDVYGIPKKMLYELIISIIRFLLQFLKKKSTPPQPITKVHEETQFEKSCKKYALFYDNKTEDESSNIDPVLYDFEKRKEIFGQVDNDQEKLWKSRILLENSPRGNVLMYYNPYTLSFVYHSDEQIIPYIILEQIAKKYVVMYRCKDFFIDSVKRPENKVLEVLQKEEDALKSKKMKVADITKCVNVQSDSKDVFAALKDYRTPAGPAQTSNGPNNKQNKRTVKEEEEVKFSNKFVRIGKMCEFNILQKPADKKIEAVNELMFGTKPVNKVIDFFADDDDDDDDFEHLEIKEIAPTISSYKQFKMNAVKNSFSS
jgi:hypothetical protein